MRLKYEEIMDKLNSKKKKTVLIALSFLAVFTVILLMAEWYLFMRDIREDGLFKADSIRKTILSYQSEFKETEEQFYGKLNDNVRLSVFILNKLIDGGEYTGRTVFDDGMIVQVKNGRTELPSGGDAIFPDLKAEDLTPEYTPKLFTTADGRDVLVTTGRILDGVYYLDWTDYEEYREFFYSRIEVQRLLNFMADAYGGEIFLISDDVPKGAVLLGTDESEAFSNIGELALRQKDHNNREFSLNTKSDRYICYVMPLEGTERTVVYCDTVTDEVQTGLHRAFTKVIFSGCFLAALLVFCFSSITGIKYGLISEKRSPEYTPKKMKQKILLISLLSGLALMFITIFTTFVQESHHENRKGISILDSLELQLSESDHRREMANQTEINWYQYYAKTISAKITDSPQILDKESLSGITQIINADLIMAFDENGIETVSSSDYIGFTLDDDTKDQDTSDLKKLLKGIPAVIRGPEPDFITGQEHYIIGVPYQLAERAGYGALLFFIDPSAFTNEDEGTEIRRIHSNLTTGEELIMEIDPETFDILSSSDPKMVKSKIRDLDLNEQDLQENKLDIFAHDNVLYYGISRTIRERIWYYAEKISGIVISSLVYSAITSLIFVIICLLTGRCAMNGYTQAYFEECLSANRNAAQAADNRSTPVFLSDMKPLTKADIARKKYRYSPVNKTVTVLWVLCGLAMLILLAAGFLSKNAALAFYVTGSWQRGINPFAFTAIAVIVCIGRLLLIGLDKLFSLIILEMSDKGKTIPAGPQSFAFCRNYRLIL